MWVGQNSMTTIHDIRYDIPTKKGCLQKNQLYYLYFKINDSNRAK